MPHQLKDLEDVKDWSDKRKIQAAKLLGLSSLSNSKGSWNSFDDYRKIIARLPGGEPIISEQDRWMDDSLFGWQFLNGGNPNDIRRCEVLPKNFPVSEDMVKGFLDRGKSLTDEMKVFYLFSPSFELKVCIYLLIWLLIVIKSSSPHVTCKSSGISVVALSSYP